MLRCADEHRPLTRLEKLVIDYMNLNISSAEDVSISDIAQGAYVSLATVSRAVRKCGFPNFTAACYHLASEKQDKLHENYMNEILSKVYEECTQTIGRINLGDIEKAVEYINDAPRIILLARGQTRLIAEDFSFQLQCLRYNATVMSDANIMRKIGSYASQKDLIFVLTVQSCTPELTIAARKLKDSGCRIVCLCCKGGTELEEIADITIRGHSLPITPNRALDGMSRVPLMILTRTLSEYLSMRQN